MATTTILEPSAHDLNSATSNTYISSLQISPRTSHNQDEIELASSQPNTGDRRSPSVRPTPSPQMAASAVKSARANLIIFQIASVNFLASMASGIIVVGLPHIASDLHLPEQLYLWPSSVFGLTTGAALLPAGAVADVMGARNIELLGISLLGAFTLACGLAETGIQLVLFRAFQGLSLAMHLPCSVSLVTKFVPSGKRRNVGFACLGFSMPLGFGAGLVLGGILVDTIGWRLGFYIPGAIMILEAIAGLKIIPAEMPQAGVLHKLKSEIDWIGAIIASASLAMFSYVLAILSTDSNNMEKPSSIVMLTISVGLMVLFPFWIRYQEKQGNPALIPNYLWKNIPFSCICVLTVLTWGVMNSMELFSSLYFQEVQDKSALNTSLQLLPNLLMGTCMNLATGYIVDRVPTFWLVLAATTLTSGSSLVMAIISPHLSYWKGAFFAQLLAPLAGDVLFTVGLIVVSEVFPERTQSLAGAVYNTVAYFGLSLGLNSMQVVSLLVTKGTQYRDKSAPAALLQGYRASFWTMFAITLGSVLICIGGLRRIGKIGLKRD